MPKSEPNKKKSEHWRRYKGTSAEDLCAAIRELWLAKSPNYIRMLNELPNKLIEREASAPFPDPKEDWYESPLGNILSVGDDLCDRSGRKLDMAEKLRIAGNWNRGHGRRTMKDLETFLDTPPLGDHFYDTEAAAIEDELYWKDPDAPLSDYADAERKRIAIIERWKIKPDNG
jgi:hypothetical protein